MLSCFYKIQFTKSVGENVAFACALKAGSIKAVAAWLIRCDIFKIVFVASVIHQHLVTPLFFPSKSLPGK